jgi:CspA family cold shock protein
MYNHNIMTTTTQYTPVATFEEGLRVTGRVKWFNNKAGYGFISVETQSGVRDVFVHHSAINVNQEQYKYLVQGEYVEFECSRVEDSQHEWQASTVRGLNGGKLMCETRRDIRESRVNHARSRSENDDSETTEQLVTRRPRRVRAPQSDSQYQSQSRPQRVPVRSYGGGPRDDGVEWMLVRRYPRGTDQIQQGQPQRRQRQGQPRYAEQ